MFDMCRLCDNETCLIVESTFENQNGSLNEDLSNKRELNIYQGCVFGGVTPAGDFRRPDICSQEQEEGVYTTCHL